MKMKKNAVGKDLLQRAKELACAGYSPIPVQGNNCLLEPKRPAVAWKAYQGRIACERELERVFNEKVTGIGIVCGRVSRLLVIDFDDLMRYQRFCRHLPQYAETYTVKTKRGFHLYFRTAEKVPSHQFDGGDIKAEKSYVVAPPSQIGSFVYRCVQNVAEIALAKADLDRILNYFHVDTGQKEERNRELPGGGERDLADVYRRLAPRLGRNNALYRVACLGREAGYAKWRVEQEILKEHIEMMGRAGHRYESRVERAEEGWRTIESAFKAGEGGGKGAGGIPNTVRERLLAAQGSTVMARLLDIFLLAGWQAGAYFTLAEAIGIGERFGLNRKSVLQALTGECSSFDGRHIVSRRYVEYLDIKGLKERKRGRPVELMFRAPSTARLLRLLKVGRSPCDRLGKADVRSARAYRMALHREYISRLQPRASLAVLARRIGVNERTIRRYNHALRVQVTACIGRIKLSREIVRVLPKRGRRSQANSTSGFWLERRDGSRLPAWRHIGSRMLKLGEPGVDACARLSSGYSLAAGGKAGVVAERLSLAQFVRVLSSRAVSGGRGWLDRLGAAVKSVSDRAAAIRYEKIQLSFENVAARIAEDKVADTINGYLFAGDGAGGEVRRPAKRGIAYRMLKEYGNGNVYLALRSSYREVMVSLARHALLAGESQESMRLVALAST